MSKLFAQNTKYGELEYDEILLYYDGPCIFSVRNKLGYRFVCLLETESENADRYLVVPVSLERYNLFIRNNWSIRNLYTQAEMGGVFSVTFSDGQEICSEHSLTEIECMNLPEANEMLEFNGGYTTKEILVDSAEKNVPIFQKSLEKNGTHRQFIFADEFAKESKKFQEAFYGIAKDWLKRIPDAQKDRRAAIMSAARIPYYATFPASFGIQIEGLEYPLIGEDETDFAKIVKTFFELTSISGEQSAEFFEEHQNALIALKSYYKTLLSLGFSVKMKAATPRHEYYKRQMSQDEISNRYGFLSRIMSANVEQVVLIGTWTQISFEAKTFRFKSDDGKVINGKFDEDFDESVFDFGRKIKILVEKEKKVGRMREESEKYTLLSVVQDAGL